MRRVTVSVFSGCMTSYEAVSRKALPTKPDSSLIRVLSRPSERKRMKFIKSLALVLTISTFFTTANAQRTEITISFSEQFFDALLDAVFTHAAPPEFSLASNEMQVGRGVGAADHSDVTAQCNESIRLLRENDGIRTGVRFRDGKIVAPIAFTGRYNPPFIGCVPFGGVAEAVIDLQFDINNQRLIAIAKAEKVSLSGTGCVGSSLIARMVQGTIDKKINPIEIIRTDKVTFVLPVQNSNSVRMRAVGFRHDLANGMLNVRIGYEFEKVK